MTNNQILSRNQENGYMHSRRKRNYKRSLFKHACGKILGGILPMLFEDFGENREHHSEKNACRPQVFISYSRFDKRSLKELHAHLDHYALMKEIDYWDDTKIQPGAKWKDEMRKALKATTVAVLLVSAEFLASDFIIKNELPPLLRSASQNGTTILCVILRHCAFIDTNLAEFQAINPPSHPLSEMSRGKRDAIWTKVAKLIKKSSSQQQNDNML